MKTPTVEINRICTLKKGDKFLYDGYWREVIRVDINSIKYKSALGYTDVRELGKKSQLFVQISRENNDLESKTDLNAL